MSEETTPQKAKESTSVYIKLMFLGLLVVALTLPFHYVPDRLMMFPKETLTFSHTFIMQSDIDRIIDRYNNASTIFEQQSIANEPLIRKLTEKALIVDKNQVEDFSDDYSDDFEVENQPEKLRYIYILKDKETGELVEFDKFPDNYTEKYEYQDSRTEVVD